MRLAKSEEELAGRACRGLVMLRAEDESMPNSSLVVVKVRLDRLGTEARNWAKSSRVISSP